MLPSLASHRGGTLTLTVIASPNMPDHFLDSDPAVVWEPLSWQVLSLTNDGLVGHRRAAGLAGNQLVPDLATALPVSADGGRTYAWSVGARRAA